MGPLLVCSGMEIGIDEIGMVEIGFNGAAARVQRNGHVPVVVPQACPDCFNGAAARVQRNEIVVIHLTLDAIASMGPLLVCSGMLTDARYP